MPIIDNGAYFGWNSETNRAQCGGYPDDKSREPLNKRIEAKYGRIGGEDLIKALGYLKNKHNDKHAYHAPELNCRELPECRSCGSLRSVDIKPAAPKAQPSSRKSSLSASIKEEATAKDETKSVKKCVSGDTLASSASSRSIRSASSSSTHSKLSKRSSISAFEEEIPRGTRKNSK